MKRFFPLVLGLSLILFSFKTDNKSSLISESSFLVSTLMDICEFKIGYNSGTNHCPGMPAELIISPDCEGIVEANLLVANLDPDPVVGMQYSLPQGVPALYIETEHNGNVETVGPITTFDYNGRIKKVNNIVYHIYEHPCDLTFDVFEECSSQTYSIFFDSAIKDDNGNVYPVATYSGSGEIFQYDLFHTTSPVYYMEGCAEACNGCAGTRRVAKEEITLNSETTFTLENDVENVTEENVENTSKINFNVAPNPFDNEITLVLERSTNSNIDIEMVDMNGKIAMRKSISSLNDNFIKLNTTYLNSGVYYCRLIANGKVTTKRMVKY